MWSATYGINAGVRAKSELYFESKRNTHWPPFCVSMEWKKLEPSMSRRICGACVLLWGVHRLRSGWRRVGIFFDPLLKLCRLHSLRPPRNQIYSRDWYAFLCWNSQSFHLHTGVGRFTFDPSTSLWAQAMPWTGSFRTFIVHGSWTGSKTVKIE